MDLVDRVAVVTGGGRGIGADVARALAHAGAAVAVCGRGRETLEPVAAELRAAGARTAAVLCDVTDPTAVTRMAARVSEELGPVDVLVNNAGTTSSAPLAKTTLDEWNRLFAVNATGTFLATQAVVGGMRERGWGRVVNVASVAALSGARYIAAYAASKHAVLGFTRCVAAELVDTGVTINAVCPGFVDTPMTRDSIERIVRQTGRSEEEALAALLETAGQGRLVRPEEVAHAILSLCAREAGAIHGQAIVVDGGALLA